MRAATLALGALSLGLTQAWKYPDCVSGTLLENTQAKTIY